MVMFISLVREKIIKLLLRLIQSKGSTHPTYNLNLI